METKVLAVVNQKGGVGKTTTTANLAYALTKLGKEVLVIDFDSQASLTQYLNYPEKDGEYYSIADLLYIRVNPILYSYKESPEDWEDFGKYSDLERLEKVAYKPVWYEAVPTTVEGKKIIIDKPVEYGFWLIPSSMDLAIYEMRTARENPSLYHLRNYIHEVIMKWKKFDYIIIDCNPSLGDLTSNAIIAASDGLIIPTNLSVMSARGISRLLDRIEDYQRSCKEHGIKHYGVAGILLNLYASRRKADNLVEMDITNFYPFKVFDTKIPDSTKAKDAEMCGVLYYQMFNRAADAYDSLAKEFEERIEEMEKAGPIIYVYNETTKCYEIERDVELATEKEEF